MLPALLSLSRSWWKNRSTRGNGAEWQSLPMPLNHYYGVRLPHKGRHQPKTVLWVTKSHSCHQCEHIRSWCQMQTKGRSESHNLTTSTRSWSPWWRIHYGVSPCKRGSTCPPLVSKATTLSSKGHKDIKHSGSPRFNGNMAQSFKTSSQDLRPNSHKDAL